MDVPHKKLIIGCGYLGRRVARHWLAQGAEVSALTRSATRAQELRQLGVRPIVGDVLDPPSLAALPDAPTVLYAVGLDRAAGRTQREVYVDGLRHVLSRAPGRATRFLYISSTSVYGQDAGEWVDEQSERRPAAPNGQVCLEAETLLRDALPGAVILRLAGIYGPDRLIARIEQLRAGAPLAGLPAAWLNLIHVEDAVAAVLAGDAAECAGRDYIVCDDRPLPRREFYERLAALIGAPAPRFEEPADPTPAGGLNKRCSNRRLRRELGLELRYPTVAEGLPAALGE